MPIKLILFDIDNTLIFGRNADKFYNQYYLALQKLVSSKMDINDAAAKNIIRKHIAKGFRSETILDKLGIDITLLHNSLVKIDPHNYLKPQSDIISILNDLKKAKVKLGFITDSPIVITNEILRSSGIKKELFDIRIGWRKNRKMPKAGSPYIYHKICQTHNIKPKEIIMIGDSLENDILPARKVGMNTILISRNIYPKIITIPSIKSLPQILKEKFRVNFPALKAVLPTH